MQLLRIAEALAADLAAVAAVGDEESVEAARRVALSLRGSIAMRLLEALGEAARELDAQIPDGRIEVRLVGQDPELVFVRTEEESSPRIAGDELTARITLRLPDSLKKSVEAAADREGVSVNTWLIHALARSVHGPAARSGRRLTGFAET
jgi:hypothetical protein